MLKIPSLIFCTLISSASNLRPDSVHPFLPHLFSYNSCCPNPKNCESLGDGICDTHLNTETCAWDKGDCGFCSPGCYNPTTQSTPCSSPSCTPLPSQNRTLSSTPCKDGQIHLSNTCFNCPDNTYSIQYFESNTCFECTDRMDCTNNTIKPKTGTYRFTDRKLQRVFRTCFEPTACEDLMEKDNLYQTDCTHGYKGKMCHSCKENFTKVGLNTCAECPNQAVNVLLTIAIIVVLGLLTYFLIKTTLINCFDTGKFHSVGFKMFVNYIQVIYLCLQYRIKWPAAISKIASSEGSSNTKASSLRYYYFSIKCLFDPAMQEEDLFYYRVYFMVCLPLVILMLSYVTILSLSIFSKDFKKVKHYKTITILVPFLLLYPFVLSYSLSPIACESLEIGKPDNFEELKSGDSYPSYLIENRDIDCNSETHLKRSFPASLIGLFVWGISAPAGIFLVLYFNRKNLHQHKFKYRYGFLFNGYLRQRYYWEFVIISKKFTLVILTIIMQSGYSPVLQSILLVASLIIYLIFHVYFRPYITEELNHIEFVSSLTAIITILAGIIFNESGKLRNEWILAISGVVIVVVNVYFLWVWGKFMFFKNIWELLDRFEFLKKYFDYNDGFDPKISNEFDGVNYMYTEEMQTVYTQIKDKDNAEEKKPDFNVGLNELVRKIVLVNLHDYIDGVGPALRKKNPKPSIFIH